jgi:hypothetical protein
MKSVRIAFVAGAIVALVGSATVASAEEFRLRCDYKAPNSQGKGERTRVRVDGKEVAEGTYTVTLNGLYTATATAVADEDDGEFEFKTRFSSNHGHVTGGATEIPKDLGAADTATVDINGSVYTVECPGRTRIETE